MGAPKNSRRLSNDVRDRIGVYKRLEQVPRKYRLTNYTGSYEGRDVWKEYADEKTERFDSKHTRNRYEKAGRYLQMFASDAGRHRALLRPDHAEEFLVALRDGEIGPRSSTRKLQTVYFEYFQPVDEFYSWLEWRTDHPHVYHPIRMAVAEGGFAREVWGRKLDQNDKR